MAEKAARRHERPDMRVYPSGSTCDFTERCWHVAADRAAAALREPLHIVVEDETCDGAFLQKVVLRVGEFKLRRRLGDHRFAQIQQRWTGSSGDGTEIRVNHGGGARTPQVVASVAEGEPRIARRVFVFVDSDRCAPSAPLGSTAIHVKKKCEELEAKYGERLRLKLWILNKREVENYLPGEALRAFRSTVFDRWSQFAEQQKDYEDLKLLFGSRLSSTLTNVSLQKCFHEQALRERAGSELDEFVKCIADFL